MNIKELMSFVLMTVVLAVIIISAYTSAINKREKANERYKSDLKAFQEKCPPEHYYRMYGNRGAIHMCYITAWDKGDIISSSQY